MTKSLKLIVEALLFASEKPMSAKDLHGVLTDTKPADIASALRVLKYEYEAMGRSYALQEVAGGYQFRTRSEFGAYVLKMMQASPARLSRATMETLAIIAYKQPIMRQEVERIRGVDVGGILRTLLEKDLIKIMGRENLPGRPLVYGTTRKFLEVFDLKNIDSLPKLKELKALGIEDNDIQEQEKRDREAPSESPSEAPSQAPSEAPSQGPGEIPDNDNSTEPAN
jgi:segregation and condensation protein B